LVDSNGHVVSTTDCYRRTRQFVTTILPKMGVRLTVRPKTKSARSGTVLL
jgi:cystathionine gamma-synthase